MTYPVALAGGLVDSKAIPEAGDLQILSNFVIYRNRFALRAPVVVTVQLMDDEGSPQPVDTVLSIKYHDGHMYAIGYKGGGVQKAYLYKLNLDGTGSGPTQAPTAVLWSGSAAVPTPVMVSFHGGTTTGPVSRLYISDYSGQYDTMFWNSDASSINNLQDDFADSGSLHNTRYGIVFSYQYTMWGTGFFQFGAGARQEMMRFSQPGAIPAAEPDITGGVNPREWWAVDHREVGVRNEPITNVGFAGGAAIIFKRKAAYALQGYDADSWAIRQISDKIGAVGPYASCNTEDGLCFFWSDIGPMMTDGQTVVDLSVDIRKFVQAVGFNTGISCEYSPDDRIVYFVVPQDGAGTPNLYLAYQRQTQPVINPPIGQGLYSSGQWLNSGGTALTVSMINGVPNLTLPGPIAAPTGMHASAVSDTEIDLTWVNGDTALDTVTEIHRGFTPGFAVSGATLLHTVDAGVASYNDTTLTQSTTAYYKVKHLRNSIYSALSGEVNDRTFLAAPTNFSAVSGSSTGIVLSGTNNAPGADIILSRASLSSSQMDIVTLPNPGATFTYTDNGITGGVTYCYQARASKVAEHDSVNSTPSCSTGNEPPPVLDSASFLITPTSDCPSGPNVLIQWTAHHIGADDTALIERNVDSAGWNDIAQTSLRTLSYQDIWQFANSGGSNHTIQYRVTAYKGTTVAQNTITPATQTWKGVFC